MLFTTVLVVVRSEGILTDKEFGVADGIGSMIGGAPTGFRGQTATVNRSKSRSPISGNLVAVFLENPGLLVSVK